MTIKFRFSGFKDLQKKVAKVAKKFQNIFLKIFMNL